MSDKIEFIVYGEPRPKGSKNAFVCNFPYGKDKGKVAARRRALATAMLKDPWVWRPMTTLSEVSKGLKPWEAAVKKQAKLKMASEPAPWEGPIRMTMIFFMKRPMAHFGSGKNAGVIKERYVDALPLKVPDLSKLFRAAEDGLNEVVFNDDCQVVEMVSKKFYGRKNGVRIIVEKVDYKTVKNSEPEQLLLFPSEDL